jgi:hypothetical protein
MVTVCQSDRGGLKELYSPNSSWIFSPLKGNLTEKLNYILSHQDELIQKKMNCVSEIGKFSVKKYIDKHLALYDIVTAKKDILPKKKNVSSVIYDI